jgi:hypothetical protein
MSRACFVATSGVGLVLAALVACGCPPSPEPPKPPRADAGAPTLSQERPAWKPKSFVRATEGCTQTWTCDCSGAPLPGACKLVPTGDDSTTGVCAADSGPVNGCTRCMALPPTAACECRRTCP